MDQQVYALISRPLSELDVHSEVISSKRSENVVVVS